MSQPRKSITKRFKEQLLGETFQKVYHIICRFACLSTFLVQFVILDVYLVIYNNLLWCLWIIPDSLVLAAFLTTAIISYKHLSRRLDPKKQWMGELPLSYITWLLYSAILSAKFCIIFALPDGIESGLGEQSLAPIARSLKESNFLGPNMLQTSLCLTSIVLYVFVLSLHDAKAHSDQSNYITAVIGSSFVDILDAVSFSSILQREEDVIRRYRLDRLTLAIVSFNFILPTEALLLLSKSYFGKFPMCRRNQLIHKVGYFVAVNLPMFLVRMVIWHLHEQSISVFLVKNVLALGLAVKDIHDFAVEVKVVITDSTDGALEDVKVEEVEMEVKDSASAERILKDQRS